jgi:catechol 2,3-dioxygenase-like lactoylglutathione lyase family enzyme
MLDHVSLGVKNLKKAQAFYDAALKPLGYKRVWDIEGGAAYGRSAREPRFWLSEPAKGTARGAPGSHIAFVAANRARVRAFYEAALAAGAKDNGEPGLRTQYHPNYYGAFVIDPDGNHIEAVCHLPK